MSNKREIYWWAYVLTGILLFFFLAPALISMADTLSVLLGLVVLVVYGRWTWSLWFKKILNYLIEDWKS